MIKNSETLKAWMLSGFTPCEPDDQGATFIVDGQWYAPMWGCDTIDLLRDKIHSALQADESDGGEG